MSIRTSIRVAFVALTVTSAGSAFATQGTACPNPKMSKQIAKPMLAAQEALKKQKWRDVLAKTKEAKAVTGFQRSAFDEFWVHEFEGYAYNYLSQPAEAAKEWEAVIASPCATAADKTGRYKALANVYFNLKNYPKAIDYANKGLAAGRDPELLVTLGQAYYQSGDNKNAQRVMNDVITVVEQRGTKPNENTLLIVLNACERSGDTNCKTKLYEKLVTYYPKQEYWQNLTSSLMAVDSKDEQKINIMRLALAVDVMKQLSQYQEMAQIALDQGLPAEAQAIIDQAKAKNLLKDQRQKDLFDRLGKLAQTSTVADKARLGKKETDARAATTGDAYVQLGASYLSYGDNAKAVEAIKAGFAKGDLANPDEAGLLLGIAHLRSNNKAEAKKAFGTVKQDPMMVRTAKLWLLNT